MTTRSQIIRNYESGFKIRFRFREVEIEVQAPTQKEAEELFKNLALSIYGFDGQFNLVRKTA